MIKNKIIKVYVLEYDMDIILQNSSKTEHRQEVFIDMLAFISRTKYAKGQWYMHNIKTYIGNATEINTDKVINPWDCEEEK